MNTPGGVFVFASALCFCGRTRPCGPSDCMCLCVSGINSNEPAISFLSIGGPAKVYDAV